MAVNSIPKGSKVKMEFNNGLDEYGRDIIKPKTLSGVKSDATNEGLYQAMASLSGLQSLPLVAVKRIDETQLELV
ncbi:DUF1659 domain-containing protein [Clostridium sp. D2Q-11]|uniref:DUF1659 domain-containing protein n=1 Tax=Anaeromonas frigoriresistens TaxID=2683708 RepID=A0A942Z665_9FIRM|nr:DUF1659 domain-containing protein [Anaeromonas frigoriresistens]MBS4538161.1 DUF1659 domain-containing protein [Anaeromonas frigoriresistens]